MSNGNLQINTDCILARCKSIRGDDTRGQIFLSVPQANPAVKQVGIYQLTRKQMAFELGYSMESVNALLERFIHHHDIIRYDYDTREICIVNWGKYNFPRAGTPIENCIRKELREVKQTDFIKIIYDKVENKKIKAVFDEYFNECPSRIPSRDTSRVSSRGEKQKEKTEKKNKKEKNNNIA